MVRYHKEILVNDEWVHLSMGDVYGHDVLFSRAMALGIKGKYGVPLTEIDYSFCVGTREKVFFDIEGIYKLKNFLTIEECLELDDIFGNWLWDTFNNIEEVLPEKIGKDTIKSFRLIYWLM